MMPIRSFGIMCKDVSITTNQAGVGGSSGDPAEAAFTAA
jgi:hypothetical protein